MEQVAVARSRDLVAAGRTLQTWLSALWPDADEVAVGEVRSPASTGFSSETLVFDVTVRRGGRQATRTMVARVAPTTHQVFPDPRFRFQYDVVRTLADTDVPVPATHGFEPDASLLGAPYFVMDFVSGHIPTDVPPYHVDGWLTTVSPAERERLWWSGLETLARVHRVPPQRFGFALQTFEERVRYYGEFLDWASRGDPPPLVAAAYDWVLEHQPRDVDSGLLWGDARVGNMVFDDFTCRAVLDWEMACVGPPEEDLAWWLFLDRHHSEGCGVARLEGFPDRAETLDRYASLLGRDLRDMQFHEVFAGLKFGVVMTRIMHLFVDTGVLPADSDVVNDNTVTRLLASMLGLPSPAPAG